MYEEWLWWVRCVGIEGNPWFPMSKVQPNWPLKWEDKLAKHMHEIIMKICFKV